MAEPVLHVAESKCSDRRRDVDDQNELKGLFERKLHHFLRIDGSQRDDDGDPGLVERAAQQEAREVSKVANVFQGRSQTRDRAADYIHAALRLRHCALAKNEQCRQRSEGEDSRGDQHRPGNELFGHTALPARPRDIRQAHRERREAAQVAEAPAPARHFPECSGARYLRQKGADQRDADLEEKVRNDDRGNRNRDVATPG